MERIEGQVSDQEELAKQVLAWIACAKRPLTITELQHALAVEIGESEFDPENLTQIGDMVSVCAGLVTTDETSGIVRLVHYTTQQYFERTQKQWFPDVESDMATVCTTYLSFHAFGSGFCQTDDEYDMRLQSNPLYGYAAQNWGHHARMASTSWDELSEFLESGPQVEAASQALMVGTKGSSFYVPHRMSGLHLAAYFGLQEILTDMLDIAGDPDLRDGLNQTPLFYAAQNGHEAVVRLLLNAGKVDVNVQSAKQGRTPLSCAAEMGHGYVVKLLLAVKGVDAIRRDDQSMTPLTWAAAGGHAAIVKLLLEIARADSDPRDDLGRTPLSWAAEEGHEAVVKLLLETGNADADSKDHDGRTPLWYAAESGQSAVARLLLEKTMHINAWDHSGWAPLTRAADEGHDEVIRILLENQACTTNYKDRHGRSPLSLAASKGHTALAVMLLKHDDIDANCKDHYSWTPLLRASEKGHRAAVQLLLQHKDINVNSRSEDGQTSLSWAAAGGHDAVVKMLLGHHSIDADPKDKHGQTPLSWAAENGHDSSVHVLLKRNGVCADSKDECGRTPLWWAARGGHTAVVRLLLAHGGVVANSQDANGQTPLSQAKTRGHKAVVEMLIEHRGRERGGEAAEPDRVAPRASEDTTLSADVDSIIDRLLEARGSVPGKQVKLEESEIRYLCTTAQDIFISQPALLEISAPIKVRVSNLLSLQL